MWGPSPYFFFLCHFLTFSYTLLYAGVPAQQYFMDFDAFCWRKISIPNQKKILFRAWKP